MSNHTQTPWHIESVATGAYKSVVCLVSENDGKVTNICCTDADAAFIVRAVNAHDALVEALKAVREAGRMSDNSRAKYMAEIAEIAIKLARGDAS